MSHSSNTVLSAYDIQTKIDEVAQSFIDDHQCGTSLREQYFYKLWDALVGVPPGSKYWFGSYLIEDLISTSGICIAIIQLAHQKDALEDDGLTWESNTGSYGKTASLAYYSLQGLFKKSLYALAYS